MYTDSHLSASQTQSEYKMAANKRFTLNEALNYLENHEVSDDSDIEYDEFNSAEIYIEPPNNSNNKNSDVDSGDENETSGEASSLSGNQLRACAVMENEFPSGKVTKGSCEDESNTESNENDVTQPKYKRKKSDHPKHCNIWRHCDMSTDECLEWKLPPPSLETSDSSSTLFEKYFTDEILKYICDESVKYAQQKGNHSFKLSVSDMKAFIAVLLISGYVDLSRRPMFWQTAPDVQNTAVSTLMSRNRFDVIIMYLHLADNNFLDTSDKFSKVRPLISKLNERSLCNYIPEQTVSIDKSMVPYHGRHGCKQFMRNKPVKFGYKFWVAATTLGYAIQFYPYMGKDDHYDPNLGLGGSVVDKLTDCLPKHEGSSYHVIITDNFFTSP